MTNFLIGIPFLIIAYFAGFMILGIIKKNKYMRAKLRDQEFLNEFLKNINKDNPLSARAMELESIGDGYFRNIEIGVSSTIHADRGVIRIGLVIAAICVTGALFIDYWYILVSLIGFVLGTLTSIGESGYANAHRDIFSTSLILYKWHSENPNECSEFVKQAHSLEKLYLAVKLVSN